MATVVVVHRPSRLLVIPMIVAASLAACGDDSPDTAKPAREVGSDAITDRAAHADLDPNAAVDREAAVAGAVDLRADGCGPRVGFGSGAVIDERVVLTAAHVVAGADEVVATDIDGLRSSGTVVHFDPDLDLAILRLDEAIGAPVRLRSTEASADEVGVVVVPRWSAGELDLDIVDVSVVRTVNISTTDIYLEGDIDRAGFEVAGSIEPGDSGGLVVLAGGGAGVVWARSRTTEGHAWAVDLPPIVTSGEWNSAPAVDVGPCIR